jgi:putative DNA primase/helicase
VIDALKAVATVRPDIEMPAWFGEEGYDPMDLVACQNGILVLSERRLIPLTPQFFSPNILEFNFDPQARAPRLEQFLEELWPNDPETGRSVLEMFGLCLTDEIKYQKMFMFVGPRRGGRGTIARVLGGLIGKENYIGVSLHSFKGHFAFENWIGKKMAVFSDARH